MPRQLLVEKQGLADASHVVEPDAVRVSSVAPYQHDVIHERTALVRGWRNVDHPHAPALDVDPADRPNPRPRIPGRSVDELGVIRERLGEAVITRCSPTTSLVPRTHPRQDLPAGPQAGRPPGPRTSRQPVRGGGAADSQAGGETISGIISGLNSWKIWVSAPTPGATMPIADLYADESIAAPKGHGPRTLRALSLQTSRFKGTAERVMIAFLDPLSTRCRAGGRGPCPRFGSTSRVRGTKLRSHSWIDLS